MTLSTWWVDLDTLDAETTYWCSSLHPVTLSLPRNEWESLGRPVRLEVTPTPVRLF